MGLAHGLDFDVRYELRKGPLLVGGSDFDDLLMPQSSQLIIQDRDRPEHNVIEQPFQSYVSSFIKAFCESLSNNNVNATFVMLDNVTTATMLPYVQGPGYNDLAGKNYSSIQVGTGTTAPAQANARLGTLIIQGTSNGTLNKATASTGAVTYEAPDTYSITISRLFNNAGATDIIVGEVGQCIDYNAVEVASQNALLARDLVSPTKTILAGAGATFSYKLKITQTNDKSWTRNILYTLRSMFTGVQQTLYDVTGTGRSPASIAFGFTTTYCNGWAPAADDTYGIIIGTSNQVCSIIDNAVITKISHGNSGAGKMQYGASTNIDFAWTAPTISGSDCYFIACRKFVNLSGGDITVSEFAIVIKDTTNSWYFTMCRGRINGGTGVVVPAGQTLTLYVKVKSTC